MDAIHRRRRALLIASLSLLAACAGAKGGGNAIGASDKVPPRSHDAIADAGVDGAVALPASYKTTFTKVNKARFVASGHAGGRWEVDVYANEVAQSALASRSRAVPVGAVVVEEHYERNEQKTVGPIMVMEKKEAGFAKAHGDWQWSVVGSQGQLVGMGVMESCAGCHDDSPMDGLFPIVESAP